MIFNIVSMISKNEIKLIFVIVLLFFLFWEYIVDLQFIGEGFQYFQVVNGFSSSLKFSHDIFARIIFIPLQFFFHEKVQLYMLFMLLFMLSINIVLYFCVRFITKNTLTAFFTTLFFSLSHIANYDMFSSGGYQYFVQRATPFLPLIVSFALLVKYFYSGCKFKYFVLSLSSYILAVLMGFFAIWMLPLFVIYPIIYVTYKFKRNGFAILKYIIISFSYLLSSLFIISSSPFSKQEMSPIQMLIKKPTFILENIAQQFSVLVLPVGSYKVLRKFFDDSLTFQINPVIEIGMILIFLYLIFIGVLFLKLPKLRVLILTLFVSLFGILAINTYLNASTVMVSFESSRYFYYPYFPISFIWGITFAYLYKKNTRLKLVVILLVLVYMLNNYYWTYQNKVKDEYLHNANKDILNFFDRNKDFIKNNPTYIYLPSTLGPYGVEFVNKFYGSREHKFVLENFEELDYQKIYEQGLKPENLYVFHYDQKKQKVYDLTFVSRNILKGVYETNRKSSL
ncbi:MAG: hypothetical protein US28_C0011G0018 [Candidatus Daviesbacteria bacterium GW2011_GWA1_36_8]|uniref:Glycosyltransferase RgtA/B/C/D-like domain-containing protein n=3 Tax=Candidatus Daviesiibacteriota TaxID=1752718 RepID=A0A0G0EUL6_9BACT|nr:MAG: hypothetical protein US19_C0002G0012 [Candidatus Daviesbacteria bacterium GW2011_GWB1_36_5]KKQ15722.1 MAG: hypothetical protein US28_C0011G0018 [Candidatus Daviesbacteria bacterium GW2011_GWA1_36_8]